MTARILDGKKVAAEMRAEFVDEVAALRKKDITPGLGVLLVGDDPASRSYVTAKEQACENTGLFSKEIRLKAGASKEAILDVVRDFNRSSDIDGILVQLPLPDASIEEEVIDTILPEKDVDGFHPVSVGRMMMGRQTFLPCTPHGIVHLLVRSGVIIEGAHVVIVGRSNIVGRPLSNMLSQKNLMGNATVTVCHTRTPDIGAYTRKADIVVAAAGRPDTVTADMVREGAVVVDVGVNRVEDPSKKRGYRLVGDVAFNEVAEKAAAITPVPGGVGPMTITMLLFNTIQSAKKRNA
jgi:methylenetetrahydrofolate dehydrogenase (NADP+)/methenyltetrahydrofolate cyclohydrolase